MDKLIARYNSTNDLELEMTYHLNKSNKLYKKIISKFPVAYDIHEYLDITYTNKIRERRLFKNGVNQNESEIINKKRLLQPITFNDTINNVINYRLKLNNETPAIITTKNINLIRLKLRISFVISNHKVELDLIKFINNSSNIKYIKDQIFKKYNSLEEINADNFDEMILETEFINADINNEIINESINFVKKLLH